MIQEFKMEYLDEIMNIWLKTNISAHNFTDENIWKNAFDDVKNMLPKSDLFVYRENGIIKGFVGITDNSYIAGIFVLEKWQSQGIGKKLLEYCKNKYSSLSLDVFVKNEKAVSFYLGNGFKVEKETLSSDFGQMEYLMKWEKEGA